MENMTGPSSMQSPDSVLEFQSTPSKKSEASKQREIKA